MNDFVSRLFTIEGKSALVTGGSAGIGRMIAQGLVDAGARVYIAARTAQDLKQVSDELSSEGRCVPFTADLSTMQGARDLADQVAGREETLHILVNNAGTTHGAPLEEFPEAELDRAWSVNVKAPFHLTRFLLPQLRRAASAHDPARVINISSTNGIVVPEIRGHKGSAPVRESWGYAPTKAGLNMLTRHLAHKLATEHITVNAIAPGPFESRMTGILLDPSVRADIEAMVPIGRLGAIEDVVGATVFLASRAGSYLTGAILPIDGGWSAHG